MRGELTTAVPALIDTFSLQSAPCLLAGKTRTICYFPRTLCSVCLPAGSVVSMCGVQSPPPPFAKIQTGGDLTRRQLDVSRQDEIDSFSGNGHPTRAPCQSQIGHFANRQVTNWAADAAARPDLFEIEARSPRRVMVVQGGVEHRGELHKLNHFIITVFSQGSSRFLENRGSQCKRM